jgi:mannose-6-phosphate isomerase-like protein (cupin superfamily)
MPMEIVPHEPPPEADVVDELLLLLLLPHPAATIAKAATNARALTLLTLKSASSWCAQPGLRLYPAHVRWCVQPDEAPLFGRARGCEEFEQEVLRFDGPSEVRGSTDDDEVLYVLSGTGSAELGGERADLTAGTAAYVRHGTPWQVLEADGLEILSVLVHDPLPDDATHSVVGVDEVESGTATAGRQFRLLAPCASVTQFVGYIPVGRAPDHFHTYDEVVYVLEGDGALHIDGETAPLRAGSCVHLPARLVHCLENTGPREMQVLGVFRPAGSPAEAYYPDGTKAVY